MTSIKRPRCPQCSTKMHRLTVNEYSGRTNESISIGWLCKKCLMSTRGVQFD